MAGYSFNYCAICNEIGIFRGDQAGEKTKPRSLRRAGFQKNQFLLWHEAALLRLFPEWTGLADFLHAPDHLAGVFMHAGQIVFIHPPSEERARE